MILRFITKRSANGHRRYLAIDTDRNEYSTYSPRMIAEGEEIPAKALDHLRKACEAANYTKAETEGF